MSGSEERILWQGKPDKRAYVLRGSLVLIPFSMLWLVLVISWISIMAINNASWLSQTRAIVVLLIGLYFAFGRMWVAAKDADNSLYTVTDRRIIIRTGPFHPYTTEIPLADVRSVRLIYLTSGIGTIHIETAQGRRNTLWCVRNPDFIYQAIQDSLKTSQELT